MNPVLEQIMDRPGWQKGVFWAASIGFVVFIFWTYLYGPTLEEIAQLEEKVEGLNTEISQEERIAANLGRFKAQVKELDVKLKFALAELPDQKQIPELLSKISDLARDSGLEVPLFKPKAENFREFYAEVPVEIAVLGTFHQVATFFDEVGQLPRIVNINRITINEPKTTGEDMQLKVACIATTFRYLDEDERKKVIAGDAKKRK